MSISTRAFDHARLTVTDLARSRAFYDDLFGWPVAFELPDDADEETREQLWFLFGGIIYAVGDSLLGLRPVADDSFSEDRVGLDHLAFRLESRAELDAALALLEERGIENAGIKDLGAMAILEFRDPDGIALELVSRA